VSFDPNSIYIYVLQPTATRFHVLKSLNNQLIICIVEQITFEININYIGKLSNKKRDHDYKQVFI
jgi:hypothetical protein